MIRFMLFLSVVFDSSSCRDIGQVSGSNLKPVRASGNPPHEAEASRAKLSGEDILEAFGSPGRVLSDDRLANGILDAIQTALPDGGQATERFSRHESLHASAKSNSNPACMGVPPGNYKGKDVNSCLCSCDKTKGLSNRGYFWVPANSSKTPARAGNGAFCEDDDKSHAYNGVQSKCPLLNNGTTSAPASSPLHWPGQMMDGAPIPWEQDLNNTEVAGGHAGALHSNFKVVLIVCVTGGFWLLTLATVVVGSFMKGSL